MKNQKESIKVFNLPFFPGVEAIAGEYIVNEFRRHIHKSYLLELDDIADVATQLGFFDQSHFSKIFRKAVGISPGKYIKINRIP